MDDTDQGAIPVETRVRVLISPYKAVSKGQEARVVAVKRGSWGPLYELDQSVGACVHFWRHELEVLG